MIRVFLLCPITIKNVLHISRNILAIKRGEKKDKIKGEKQRGGIIVQIDLIKNKVEIIEFV